MVELLDRRIKWLIKGMFSRPLTQEGGDNEISEAGEDNKTIITAKLALLNVHWRPLQPVWREGNWASGQEHRLRRLRRSQRYLPQTPMKASPSPCTFQTHYSGVCGSTCGRGKA